jgi:peroxiredoxin-like protein
LQNFPHHYVATASGQSAGDLSLASRNVTPMDSAAPEEFGGPGNRWSPETLLVAAVADCFILTFRAIARASKFDWLELSCEVVGTLDRVERVTRFTHFLIKPKLVLSAESDTAMAHKLLEKAEQGCLISNSLSGQRALAAELVRAAA